MIARRGFLMRGGFAAAASGTANACKATCAPPAAGPSSCESVIRLAGTESGGAVGMLTSKLRGFNFISLSEAV